MRLIGRVVATGYYDMQQVRMGTKNRIRDIIRKKAEGIPFDKVEDKKEDGSPKHEKNYTDAELFELWKKLLVDKKITDDEYVYVQKCWEMAESTEKIEKSYKDQMMTFIKDRAVYQQFLSKIRGIGPVISAMLIKNFNNCERFETISALWSYTGNGVEGGKAPKVKRGEKSGFSPKLRAFTWNISESMVKLNKGIYRQIYDTSKQEAAALKFKPGELAERYGKAYKEEDVKLSKGHCHNRALRKIRKLFLAHYWAAARELAGLETKSPFAEKLGHLNIITWRDAIRQEPAKKEKEEDE
jgi:hypothetical protein